MAPESLIVFECLVCSQNCRTWLETAESYGVLDDELRVDEFKTMHAKLWFEKFLAPAEEIAEDEMGDEDEVDGEEE